MRSDLRALPTRPWHAVFFGFTVVSVVFYIAVFWSVVAAGEVFHRLGFDWSLFYAQAMALRFGAGASMYDLSEIERYLQPLLNYANTPTETLPPWPVPYPPWFAAALVPFTLPPAPIGLALWLGVSILAAFFLGYRAWQFLPDLGYVGAAAAVLAAIPVAWGLFMGQPAVLLAIAVGEVLVSFRAQKDFRAGLWLAVLLLKPQYALLFGVFVFWKRRWDAVAGLVVGGLVLVLFGAVVAGVPSLLRYPTVVSEMSDLRNSFAGPNIMMNWRALVLAVRPGIDEQAGLALVWVLCLLTMLASLVLWRGPWDPESPTFAPKFCALTLGALVGSYHSHPHGAALLIVPLAAAWAASTFRLPTRLALWAAVYAPTLFVLWITGVVHQLAISSDENVPIWTVWPNALPAVLFLTAFGLMCVDLWRARGPMHAVRA